MYKVAIIGTGMIANAAHVPAWLALKDDVEIVAVTDLVEANAVQTAATVGSGCKVYSDADKMLAEVKPDIVSVCTPNNYHNEYTIKALKAGANVLCEKPAAPGAAQVQEMYDVAKAAGKYLLVGQSMRWFDESLAAKEFAETGGLGEVYYAETAWMRRRGVPTWGMFHMKKHNTAGPGYDLAVHMLDLVLWLMGNPKVLSVSGKAYTKIAKDEQLKTSLADSGAPSGVISPRPYDYREFDVEDLVAGFVRLENDTTIVVRSSWAANIKDSSNTWVVGTEAGLSLMPFGILTNMGSYQVDVTPKVPVSIDAPFVGHYGETAHFLKVLAGEEELMVTEAQTMNVMRALEGLYNSSEIGKEIWFE